MSAMHPSRGWRGCPMCKGQKIRGHGRRVRDPWAVRRKLGKDRKLKRTDLGDV